ncbi:MAG: prepilin-type N-terminal cleavage/methylation domain-containing protein [Methylococcales bacterium]
MRSTARPETQNGFTLLEILIGLVLLSIMMTLLFGSIRMGARIWNAGEERAAQLDRMLVVENFLRQSLLTARPVMDEFSGEEPVFSFSGTRDSIQFVADLPGSARRGGLHQFNLELVEEGDSSVLIAKLKAFYPTLSGADAAIEDVRLVSGVDRFTLSYFGSDEFDLEASGSRWTDDWKDKVFMPALIKLVIRMKDGSEWPPLIVSPKLAALDEGLLVVPEQTLE